MQSIKDGQGFEGCIERINKLFWNRDNYIHDYLNKVIRAIVDYYKENRIERVFCGDGKGWKQEVDLGDGNNEGFVEVPFDWFKQKLKHKLGYYGII
ncbi:MAG: IS605 OrfB-like transposable element containing RNAse H-like and Zn finger domain [Candidatus Methanohalarchaeum thermophilum]|uniref:IS605 OrfB-like transposable element containing RNAse H-like and Zn finger domain n=1 Tax=Methanohalarchaeum thermophilum TaxID=1903181 RepID=A0A1Q6DWX2_METT1|nr:MAG: IS605 OrfB-like transposable element containing RNAse H-like and Zn finger domain [Candidatus Methanohalarchaeum thermophilum]OKY78189.1 MAG: IS605 OrfB-like transposable element containing RNAse H-like and Zn finger domain [Candidatus Methanohalarchaeum thermophilum]OKY78867.1 MAG: IS605 OrfB-like transposable element containing RNAse H-like and Zn finger domain [Candidatus Methanohalarchaeum thermophilum]OKY78959.1 MAG: IS605 OrfB-like transposable element containing RNAse H-like and Z